MHFWVAERERERASGRKVGTGNERYGSIIGQQSAHDRISFGAALPFGGAENVGHFALALAAEAKAKALGRTDLAPRCRRRRWRSYHWRR